MLINGVVNLVLLIQRRRGWAPSMQPAKPCKSWVGSELALGYTLLLRVALGADAKALLCARASLTTDVAKLQTEYADGSLSRKFN